MKLRMLILFSFSAAFGLSACGGGDKPAAKTAPPTSSSAVSIKPENTPVKTLAATPVRDRGETVFKKCKVCHTLKEGERHKVGPNLFGVIDAPAASKDGFNYSKAMKASGMTWTDANLDGYLTRPNKFIPGNQMTFIGLKKPEDRAAVIAYLKKETTP